ncbi:MAG: hypothetical protein AB7J35_17170 [Dehalococcoidia bacterium]
MLLGGASAVVVAGAVFAFVSLRGESGGSAEPTPDDTARVLIDRYGGEDAIRAALRAIDLGYSYEQLAEGAESGRLELDGRIHDAFDRNMVPLWPPYHRYARTPPGSPRFVSSRAPAWFAETVRPQESPIDKDLTAVLGLAKALPENQRSSNSPASAETHRALVLLLALHRSGYSNAEIFVALADPDLRLAVDFNNEDEEEPFGTQRPIYIRTSPRPDGSLPETLIDCPESIHGTRKCEDLEAAAEKRFRRSGSNPASSLASSPAASENGSDDAPSGQGVTYFGSISPLPGCVTEPVNELRVVVVDSLLSFAFRFECSEFNVSFRNETPVCSRAVTTEIVMDGVIVAGDGSFEGSATDAQTFGEPHGIDCSSALPPENEQYFLRGTVQGDVVSGSLGLSETEPGPITFTATRK